MATEVLPPHDLLFERLHVPGLLYHRRRIFAANGNLTSLAVKRKQQPKHDKRTFNAAAEAKKSCNGERRRKDENTTGGLVMGKVTILRRGESLSSISSKLTAESPKEPIQDLAVLRSGSQEISPKNIRLFAAQPDDTYAGTAFALSPSPRSVPLPSFFNKKEPFEHGATRDLRRMLRLE